MGGEWALSVRRDVAGSFTTEDQRKWELACEVLKDIARSKDLRVASKLEEEDHAYHKSTVFPECSSSKCTRNFKIWHPVRYGGIDVPVSLNGANHVCTYKKSNKWRSSPPIFAIHGCIKWATSGFCGAVEAVLAFLFPGMFEVEWDAYDMDSLRGHNEVLRSRRRRRNSSGERFNGGICRSYSRYQIHSPYAL
jgi:hypothetical protein